MRTFGPPGFRHGQVAGDGDQVLFHWLGAVQSGQSGREPISASWRCSSSSGRPEIGTPHCGRIQLGTEVGRRPGELYGLHGHRVDWLRGKVQVADVMTRAGLRQWPKSKKSHRVVPVPPHILEGMSALMAGSPPDALVFTAAEGSPVDNGNFRDRIWYPADGQRASAVSRPGSCATPPPAGSSSTGCRCPTSRSSSAMRATGQLSGTLTRARRPRQGGAVVGPVHDARGAPVTRGRRRGRLS